MDIFICSNRSIDRGPENNCQTKLPWFFFFLRFFEKTMSMVRVWTGGCARIAFCRYVIWKISRRVQATGSFQLDGRFQRVRQIFNGWGDVTATVSVFYWLKGNSFRQMTNAQVFGLRATSSSDEPTAEPFQSNSVIAISNANDSKSNIQFQRKHFHVAEILATLAIVCQSYGTASQSYAFVWAYISGAHRTQTDTAIATTVLCGIASATPKAKQTTKNPQSNGQGKYRSAHNAIGRMVDSGSDRCFFISFLLFFLCLKRLMIIMSNILRMIFPVFKLVFRFDSRKCDRRKRKKAKK